MLYNFGLLIDWLKKTQSLRFWPLGTSTSEIWAEIRTEMRSPNLKATLKPRFVGIIYGVFKFIGTSFISQIEQLELAVSILFRLS